MSELIAVIRKEDVKKLKSMKTVDIIDEMFMAMERDMVEEDENYVQPIPYAAVIDSKGRILIYERKGSEKRLHGKLSIGVGGHIKSGESVFNALVRELREEVGIEHKEISSIKYLGAYYNDKSGEKVDKVHVGLMFIVKLNVPLVEVVSKELEGKFRSEITPEEYERLELWSKALLEMVGEKHER